MAIRKKAAMSEKKEASYKTFLEFQRENPNFRVQQWTKNKQRTLEKKRHFAMLRYFGFLHRNLIRTRIDPFVFPRIKVKTM